MEMKYISLVNSVVCVLVGIVVFLHLCLLLISGKYFVKTWMFYSSVLNQCQILCLCKVEMALFLPKDRCHSCNDVYLFNSRNLPLLLYCFIHTKLLTSQEVLCCTYVLMLKHFVLYVSVFMFNIFNARHWYVLVTTE